MSICVLGINHKTAELDIREQFSITENEYQNHLKLILNHSIIESAVVISTCNRTEYYLSVSSIEQFKQQANRILQNEIFNFEHLSKHIYWKTGDDCASHLFAVTAGVDSLVLGETQIQGQVKKAFDEASQLKLNSELNKLFQMAFKTAKLVRSDTEIGRNPVSIAHCAVQLGRQIFGSLNQQKILIIGAGETAELVIRYLINHDAKKIVIANRTNTHAQRLAQLFNAETLQLSEVNAQISQFDLIFSATASPSVLVDFDATKAALKVRKYKPMVMIDLSVPRDIDDRINSLDDVFLYAVDDLQKVITENMQRRENTVEQAQRIIEAEAEFFDQWMRRRHHHDLIQQYQTKVDAIKQGVINKQTSMNMNDEQKNKLTTTAHQVSKKMSHDTISGMRKIIESGNYEHIKLMTELLNLDLKDDA